MTTRRNAYHRPMAANWWQKSGFFRFYMLREGTALPALWFSLELIAGLFALKRGPAAWIGFVDFLQHPVVLLLNVIALAAAILHSKTWFELAPKASVIVIGNKKLSPRPVIIGLWIAMTLISLVVLAWAMWA
ncbi:fumarate reductase subunit FrdC [Erwinia oleae]|uniref:fumarate reductase subunit FrdC n=1 Tax=Erwinia oleae TaxID=796334 RepID=UPI0005559995|nr:fumarate reductase subunit FrdC [Erwinia oleae]